MRLGRRVKCLPQVMYYLLQAISENSINLMPLIHCKIGHYLFPCVPKCLGASLLGREQGSVKQFVEFITSFADRAETVKILVLLTEKQSESTGRKYTMKF